MNIYEKLQEARVELQGMNLKKSGKNSFAQYDYFELADFMPHINRIMLEKKLTGFCSFTEDLASLTLVNSEKPEERIVFTSPMSKANLKGCHEVQNLGAVETYQRRYLYTTAVEIVEADLLDTLTGAPNQSLSKNENLKPEGKTSKEQSTKEIEYADMNAREALYVAVGEDKAKYEALLKKYKVSKDEIPMDVYDKMYKEVWNIPQEEKLPWEE